MQAAGRYLNWTAAVVLGLRRVIQRAITAYEVLLNGRRMCVAGIAGSCVLNAMVDFVNGTDHDELLLTIGGLVSVTGEQLIWVSTNLKVGDEIRVKLLDAGSVDEPTKRYFTSSQQDVESQKAYVRAIAQKLGWTVVEGSLIQPE